MTTRQAVAVSGLGYGRRQIAVDGLRPIPVGSGLVAFPLGLDAGAVFGSPWLRWVVNYGGVRSTATTSTATQEPATVSRTSDGLTSVATSQRLTERTREPLVETSTTGPAGEVRTGEIDETSTTGPATDT